MTPEDPKTEEEKLAKTERLREAKREASRAFDAATGINIYARNKPGTPATQGN